MRNTLIALVVFFSLSNSNSITAQQVVTPPVQVNKELVTNLEKAERVFDQVHEEVLQVKQKGNSPGVILNLEHWNARRKYSNAYNAYSEVAYPTKKN